jgi:DNA-directed RNA polymerase specialized sigma24 family protein
MSEGRWECLRYAVLALSERERLLLQLTRIDGLSPDDLAIVLGCPREEAESDLRRAERGLEKLLSRRPTLPREA